VESPPRHYRKESGLVTRSIAGETIIVPVRRGVGDLDSIYTLNEVGTRIWQLLEAGPATPEIARVLSREFEVDERVAEADVEAFLGSLLSSRLVRAVPGAAP
jgi:Coenzyme PQQ synthesis protein D (PqqD)